ncbi:hypothetical protein NLG97_g2618 [Lecanicillium saksenae]|uniref:Uncharacterized protein n=1 Tax=Lecanicillium saksenae TaxID=468837 RepID=A0ACC1R0G1_9HYPO|nr:hypothetical protein NLG97_g2618 [Lecanicillium saksenae]
MSQSASEKKFAVEPIAIVGSSCRFPGGASSPSKLWELLMNPRDVLSEIPPSRFNTAGRYNSDSQHHGSTNVRHAYLFDEDPRVFDCDFFNISPREAESMDPQQRMLLETVYEGIESAGYSIPQLRGSATAVFVGVAFLDYQSVSVRGLETLPQYHATGVAMSVLANRISYFYDWKGPSVAMDTACSSSMVALHHAVQTLRNDEADIAVVAGSSLILGPEPFISGSNLNMLSPNGRSYMWDKDADGYTRGEGFSSVILKRLSKATTDGDYIECIIRETGVNQDGRTAGITMPSATAQATLMATAYARAGLDLTQERDRPQFFEAHGTGTQAGDPKEAKAISDVFFATEYKGRRELLVGSIKTIIGHHEGGAGLASIIKASLMLQNGQVPANLHFNALNNTVQPFYTHLRIPTKAEPWPALPEKCPRRVSVNSFGFGGTNAHAILESWPGFKNGDCGRTHRYRLFVISANSAQALAAQVMQLCDYLRSHPHVDMERLAYTLFRRAAFPFRAAFSAIDAGELAAKLGSATLTKNTRAMVIPQSLPVRILGIFTGQGAQWPTMGAGLYNSSGVFRNAFLCMQQSLDSLPEEQDRPSWRLSTELCASAPQSRMGDAAMSQPLCTALQVALIDMLRASGVTFSGIVAHSSGEVAAAYAAGYIDAHDAIRIAYLRGLHSHLAIGPDGEDGTMMAVGMSQDQASALCAEFGSKINVAACNSTRSCTLAGDASVINEARKKLEATGVFARILQVDKAYHSNHMLPVAEPYLKSLRKCKIKVLNDAGEGCPWYSSVWGPNGRSRSLTEKEERASLQGQYWADNMVKPVLFSDAVQRAINEGPVYDFVLEIGPHPALKGPVSETITNITAVSLPYSSLLKRGLPSAETFNDALGLLWTSFDLQEICQSAVHNNVQRAFATDMELVRPVLLKDLPSYPFNHDTIHWKESRSSALFRTQSQTQHQLLGHCTMFGSDGRHEVHWRQILKLDEISWLQGHKIQGEYLFPAMGYVTMAYEAAVRLVPATQTLKLMELRKIDIFRAINLNPNSSGTEILFTMNINAQSDSTISGRWACYSAPADVERGYGLADAPPQANAHAEGVVHLVLGTPKCGVLPQRTKYGLPLSKIGVDDLYDNLAAIGYEYTNHFRASAVLRRLNYATIGFSPSWKGSEILSRADMNPAALDTALHGLLAAYSYPGDGRLRSVYLPRRIGNIRISMTPLFQVPNAENHELQADCFLTHSDAGLIQGDLNVFDASSGEMRVQLEGLQLSALPGSQLPDRELYSEEIWERDVRFGIEPGLEASVDAERLELGEMAARLVLLYCGGLLNQIKSFETILMSKNRKNLIEWVSKDLLVNTREGVYIGTKSSWLDVASERVLEADILASGLGGSADVVLLRALGPKLPSISRGLMSAVTIAEENDALNRFYAEGVGFREVIHDTTALVSQLSHRYPGMNIAEIGCSFGPGVRRAVLGSIGKYRYKSYTVTNALAPAAEEPGVIFRSLDMAKNPLQQGFSEGMYDLLIATTSYCTNISEETLGYARTLLRPGGTLILIAMTADYLPVRFVLSLLPGSWLEADNKEPQIVSVSECDGMLKSAGFSGVDWSSSPSFCSVVLSQAVDQAVGEIRDPISAMRQLGTEILIVHDCTPSDAVMSLILQLKDALERIGIVRTAPGLEDICVATGSMVLNLCDLDNPVFSMMEESRFQGLQAIMRHASVLFWLTTGAQNGTVPDNSMIMGWSRSARLERSSLKMQILDICQDVGTLKSDTVVKLFLNLAESRDDDLEKFWTLEPELLLKGDALYIPRLWPINHLNLLSDARWKEVTVEVDSTNQFIRLGEHGQITLAQPRDDDIPIPSWEILAASAHKFLLKEERDAKRLCIVRNTVSSETKLVLTSPSAVNADGSGIELVWRYDNCGNNSKKVNYSHDLYNLLQAAIAEATLAHIRGRVWVHGAPAWLAPELEAVALRRADVQIEQTTNCDADSNEKIAFLHPFAAERDLAVAMPVGASTFVCLDNTQQGDSMTILVSKYRPEMQIESPNLSPESLSGVVCKNLTQLTLKCRAKALFTSNSRSTRSPSNECIIAIQDVPNIKLATLASTAVFDRTTIPTVTARLLPRSHSGLFQADKTYLLIGLTGEFGVSISNWLFCNGARHVVLASRNPKVAQSVVNHAATAHSASLRVLVVDICNYTSLSSAWAEIHASMPPVAGIMHGAMVMHDQLFVDQPWTDFSAVLGPKVTGTRNLVALLDDVTTVPPQLDFILFLSSAVAIAGNAGQSAYGASGWFMQAMTNELKRRGVSALALHIGPVRGLGYLHRQDRRKEMEQSIREVYAAVDEIDLFDMLAEGIAAAGRPPGGGRLGITTGISGNISAFSWRDQPRLWHFLKPEADNDEITSQDAGAVPLKTKLAAVAGDENTCLELLLDRFGTALCAMLHMKLEEMETTIPVASLGIDSLVAVRVREWFMHHVGVEVSVLKIMSANITQIDLCRDVLGVWRKQHRSE